MFSLIFGFYDRNVSYLKFIDFDWRYSDLILELLADLRLLFL